MVYQTDNYSYIPGHRHIRPIRPPKGYHLPDRAMLEVNSNVDVERPYRRTVSDSGVCLCISFLGFTAH